MKKKLSIMLVLALTAMSLSACGGSASQGSSGGAAEAEPAAQNADAQAADSGNDGNQAAAAAGEVVIGLVAPLSGSSAVSGSIVKNSAVMAVDEINAAGGIDGSIPIRLVDVDDEGVPATSVTAVQKLVESDGVNVVIGSVPSSCTLANMEVTQAAGIPQITPASSNVTVTQSGNDFIYRMTSTDAINARTLLKYAAESRGYKSFAMFYESSDFGTNGYSIVDGLYKEYGLEMTANEVYNSGDTDFSVALGRMKDTNPDFFCFWGYYTEVALICKAMQQYGIDVPIIGFGYNSPELVNLGGSAVDGIVFCTSFDAADPSPNVQEFDKKYQELYGEGYDQNGPQTYDAVYLVADAVSRCVADGKDYTDGATLNEYIASANFDGVTGNTSFDETGEMIKDLVIVTIEGGEHKILNW